jgi:hypothetical protein
VLRPSAESYKKKGEHAQKLLDLNELVQAKDEALAHKAAQYVRRSHGNGFCFWGILGARCLNMVCVQAAGRGGQDRRADRHGEGTCQHHCRT